MKLRDMIPKEMIEKLNEHRFSALPLVEELQMKIGENVETILKVVSKRIQEARDQKKFLLITLMDKTGSIRAIDWFNAEENFSKINEGDVILVRGKMVHFEDRPQLNIGRQKDAITLLQESQYDFHRFVEISRYDLEKLYEALTNFISEIQDEDYKKLLEKIFVNDKNLVKLFVQSPAAVYVHHACVGGLLEHTVSVASSCTNCCENYKFLNKDLLITGALLHDIGKIYEYRITGKGIEVTNEGEMKGHIVLGLEIIRKYAQMTNLPHYKLLELEHIILSHHGELEWGSPVLPKTAEALVVHMLENMDAKLARFRLIGEKEIKSNSNKNWSEYDKNLGRRIWLRRWENGD